MVFVVWISFRTLKSFETFLRKGGRSTDYYIPPEVCVMMNTIIDCKNKVRKKGLLIFFNVKRKAKIRNLYNQVPHLTRDTIWESDKNTRKQNTQENQEVSFFPAGDLKAERIRLDSITKTNMKHK